MHNCVAPLLADTSMRVSTPGRQCSGGMSLGSTTIIEFALSLYTPSDFESGPGCCAARKRCAADPGSALGRGRSRLCGTPPNRRGTASGTRCSACAIEIQIDQSQTDQP